MLDLLLPPSCAGCGAPGEPTLCARCGGGLPRIPRDACALCQEVSAAGDRCARCALRASPLDACIAGTWFTGEPADWIRRFKYPPRGLSAGSGRDRARVRALVGEALRWRALAPPARIVPVPLHAARLRRRGFNPAAVLARDLARASGAPLAFALARVRDTPSQTGLGRAGRRANVRGAFRARAGSAARCVWLVDDVVTTGATLEECARVLRAAGAEQVVALCAARTPASIPVREASV